MGDYGLPKQLSHGRTAVGSFAPTDSAAPCQETKTWKQMLLQAKKYLSEKDKMVLYQSFCTKYLGMQPQSLCDPLGWYVKLRSHGHFLGQLGNSVLECERCGALYNQHLEEIQGYKGNSTLQFSFAFCPRNEFGQCSVKATDEWIESQGRIDSHYSTIAQQTMELLEDSVDLEQLLSAVLGKDIVVPSSEHILHAAYKALRILWIRAFTARLPKQEVNQSKAPSERNGQRGKIVDPAVASMHQQFGSPSLWGDLRFDLQLLRDGHVTEPDIVYLYGMKTEALELIVSERLVLEASWLNAYAGMRNRVDDDHYSLMRTACQRVGTAMSRVLDANIAGLNVKFPDAEKYAFNGLRFRELHSALSANLTKLRARERAFDRPLPPSHWRDATTVFNHKRVLREYI